ncbi:unnamed protein product [Sympodiomycopsis kandeliae]
MASGRSAAVDQAQGHGTADTGAFSPRSLASPTLSDAGSIASSAVPNVNGTLGSAQMSSFNLSSLALPQQGSSSTYKKPSVGFNAISTVLNNPNKPQHPIDPHSSRFTPLPAHKDAEIPKVNKDSVQKYIDDVTQEWNRYVMNRSLGKKGKAKIDDQGHEVVIQDTQEAKAKADELPPLNAVPSIFFDEDFNLGNPYTFDIVTEKYGAAITAAAPANNDDAGQDVSTSVADGEDHLDKLSHYSDLVEQHLLHEISTRSSSFFSALGALQDLSQSSASCLSLIRSLRSDLVSISDSQVKTGLHIVRKQDHRWSILKEMQAIEQIQNWSETKRMAELMVGQGEYEDALTVIAKLKQDLVKADSTNQDADNDNDEEEDSSLSVDLDLSQIPAIQALAPELDELQATISQSLENELANILQSHLERVDDEESSASTDALPMEPLLRSLVNTRGLERCLTTTYRQITVSAVRLALRRSLPTAQSEPLLAALFDLLDDDLAATGKGESKSGEAGVVAARRLRELNVDEFKSLLTTTCTALQSMLTRIASQSKAILSTLDNMASQEDKHDTSQYYMPTGVSYSLAQTLTHQFHSSTEVAHILLARMISLRASSHIELDLKDFLQIFNLAMNFAQESERITLNKTTGSGMTEGVRKLVPLRSTLINQSKEWLRQFHRVRLENAARCVEEETWAQNEAGSADRKVVSQLVQAASVDPTDWVIHSEKGDATEGPDSDSNSDSNLGSGSSSATLEVPAEGDGESRSYYVVPATLKVLHLTKEYMTTVINFSHIGTTEIMSRAVEFLKQFNSRTCQVVLGAGAMRSAGLKNITAKHLALASQSLSLFIHLIPYLRECVRRHLPDERQAVMLIEFDKLKRDYQEHQNEIHSKLVAIMGDRISVHCKGLSTQPWNDPISSDLTASKSITDLVKETMTLHKVLSRYLSSTSVESILDQVLDQIIKRIGMEYAKVSVTSQGGTACQQKMEKDVEYLNSKFGHFARPEGQGWNVESLNAVVASKTPPASRTSVDKQPKSSLEQQQSEEDEPKTPQMASSSSTFSGTGTSTPPISASAAAGQSTPTGPPAYKSRMFPFGRRGQPPGSPQSQSQSQSQNNSSYFTPYISRTSSPHQQQQQQQQSATPTRSSVDTREQLQGTPARSSLDTREQPQGTPTKSSTGRAGEDQLIAAAQETPLGDAAQPALDASAEEDESRGDSIDNDALTLASQVPATDPESNPSGDLASEGQGAEASVQESESEEATVDSTTAEEPSSSTVLPSAESTADSSTPPVPESSSSPSPQSPAPTQRPGKDDDPPSPSTSTDSTPQTPTKPTRMTLQQRLAEAARKRSQQAQAQQQHKVNSEQNAEKEMPPPPTPDKDSSRKEFGASAGASEREVSSGDAVASGLPDKHAEAEVRQTESSTQVPTASSIGAVEADQVKSTEEVQAEPTGSPTQVSIDAVEADEGKSTEEVQADQVENSAIASTHDLTPESQSAVLEETSSDVPPTTGAEEAKESEVNAKPQEPSTTPKDVVSEASAEDKERAQPNIDDTIAKDGVESSSDPLTEPTLPDEAAKEGSTATQEEAAPEEPSGAHTTTASADPPSSSATIPPPSADQGDDENDEGDDNDEENDTAQQDNTTSKSASTTTDSTSTSTSTSTSKKKKKNNKKKGKKK